MAIPAQVKPAVWGAMGGAIAAMIVGFAWGLGDWRDVREKRGDGRANGSRTGIRTALRGQG